MSFRPKPETRKNNIKIKYKNFRKNTLNYGKKELAFPILLTSRLFMKFRFKIENPKHIRFLNG